MPATKPNAQPATDPKNQREGTRLISAQKADPGLRHTSPKPRRAWTNRRATGLGSQGRATSFCCPTNRIVGRIAKRRARPTPTLLKPQSN